MIEESAAVSAAGQAAQLRAFYAVKDLPIPEFSALIPKRDWKERTSSFSWSRFLVRFNKLRRVDNLLEVHHQEHRTYQRLVAALSDKREEIEDLKFRKPLGDRALNKKVAQYLRLQEKVYRTYKRFEVDFHAGYDRHGGINQAAKDWENGQGYHARRSQPAVAALREKLALVNMEVEAARPGLERNLQLLATAKEEHAQARPSRRQQVQDFGRRQLARVLSFIARTATEANARLDQPSLSSSRQQPASPTLPGVFSASTVGHLSAYTAQVPSHYSVEVHPQETPRLDMPPETPVAKSRLNKPFDPDSVRVALSERAQQRVPRKSLRQEAEAPNQRPGIPPRATLKKRDGQVASLRIGRVGHKH